MRGGGHRSLTLAVRWLSSGRAVGVVATGPTAADDLGLGAVAATTAVAAFVATHGLLAALRTLDHRVADAGGDELDRANRVVVARDDEVDLVRIAVGVGDRDDG